VLKVTFVKQADCLIFLLELLMKVDAQYISYMYQFVFYIIIVLLCRLRDENSTKLDGEYQALVEGLRNAQERRETEQTLANPVLPEHVLNEAVPGSIR
jgi:hypothetical protein